MRITKIVIILLVTAALIAWIRSSCDFGHLARILPFCGGHKPGIYDCAALALVGLVFWGLRRLARTASDGAQQSEATEESVEEYPETQEDGGEQETSGEDEAETTEEDSD